jgi:hypothetical protein
MAEGLAGMIWKNFTAWMRSSEIDRSGDYPQRGRFHAHLSDETLIDQWISAAKGMCLDASSTENRE